MEEKYRVSSNLRSLLDSKEWKPRDFKRALKDLGVNIADTTLANYITENGSNVRTPKPATILSMAKALKVKTGEILGDDFLKHDASVDGMIDCGEIAYSKGFGLGKNTESFKITDNSIEGFKSGDTVIIDKDESTVTNGYYLAVFNMKSQILNLINKTECYSVDFGGERSDIPSDQIKVVGKVVAKFTTQI